MSLLLYLPQKDIKKGKPLGLPLIFIVLFCIPDALTNSKGCFRYHSPG